MSDLMYAIKNYSNKYDRKIKEICSPLNTYLKVPVFTYYCIDADGRFIYLTNMPAFNEYYFSQKLYLSNPYFAHPALFRSGSALLPCTFDDEMQKSLNNRFKADHLFLTLQSNASSMEGFIFAEENVDAHGAPSYLPRLGLFDHFGRYFKREARDIIGKMRSEQFDIRKERGLDAFEALTPIPLAQNDPKIFSFLKHVTGLSEQERRCLELFKQGNSAQATAAIMGLSQRTVEHYFENIKNKLGCTSKYDLLQY